jgi:hypothetical protein
MENNNAIPRVKNYKLKKPKTEAQMKAFKNNCQKKRLELIKYKKLVEDMYNDDISDLVKQPTPTPPTTPIQTPKPIINDNQIDEPLLNIDNKKSLLVKPTYTTEGGLIKNSYRMNGGIFK